jgi:hypothetical protein
MNIEITRQLQILAGMPSGSVVMKDFNVTDMLIETGGNMLARGSLYNFVVKPIGAGVSRVTLELANPIPRAAAEPPKSDEDDWTQWLAANAYVIVKSVYGTDAESFRPLARVICDRIAALGRAP